MSPVDPTPLAQVDTLDLLRELDVRLAERDSLGVRMRIAALMDEIDIRAWRVAS